VIKKENLFEGFSFFMKNVHKKEQSFLVNMLTGLYGYGKVIDVVCIWSIKMMTL